MILLMKHFSGTNIGVLFVRNSGRIAKEVLNKITILRTKEPICIAYSVVLSCSCVKDRNWNMTEPEVKKPPTLRWVA